VRWGSGSESGCRALLFVRVFFFGVFSSGSAGTNGIASTGKIAHTTNDRGYPAAPISAPNNGGVIPVASNWLVFCAPSARPLQNGPAISAIAVKARPLSLTVTTDATINAAILHAESSASVSASSTMDAAAAAAMIRMGRNRAPIRSDHRPAATRPNAPRIWVTVTRAPADAADHPRSLISHTSEKVHTNACGTTSSTDTAWMRHSVCEPR